MVEDESLTSSLATSNAAAEQQAICQLHPELKNTLFGFHNNIKINAICFYTIGSKDNYYANG